MNSRTALASLSATRNASLVGAVVAVSVFVPIIIQAAHPDKQERF
jgi:hypothetical protein